MTRSCLECDQVLVAAKRRKKTHCKQVKYVTRRFLLLGRLAVRFSASVLRHFPMGTFGFNIPISQLKCKMIAEAGVINSGV